MATNDHGAPIGVSVVDACADELYTVRMDGAKAPSVPTARAKAITAVKFQRDTAAFRHEEDGDMWKPTDSRWGLHDFVMASKINVVFCSYAGGVRLMDNEGNIIGAVGVSGRAELDDDALAYQGIVRSYPELAPPR